MRPGQSSCSSSGSPGAPVPAVVGTFARSNSSLRPDASKGRRLRPVATPIHPGKPAKNVPWVRYLGTTRSRLKDWSRRLQTPSCVNRRAPRFPFSGCPDVYYSPNRMAMTHPPHVGFTTPVWHGPRGPLVAPATAPFRHTFCFTRKWIILPEAVPHAREAVPRICPERPAADGGFQLSGKGRLPWPTR
jgi:hypothetical protein